MRVARLGSLTMNFLKRESDNNEASASTEHRDKARVVEVGDRSHDRELLKLTTRLALMTDSRMRTMMALTYNARFKADSPLIKSLKDTNDTYIGNQRKAKDAGKSNEVVQQELGPLHVHIWSAVVTNTIEYYKDKPQHEQLIAYVGKIKSYHDVINEVKICKTGKQ